MKVSASTGFSKNRIDAFAAGREAAETAVAGLAGQHPALVIVFTTPRYILPELLSGIRSVTGETPLIGATGSGQIVNGSHMGFGNGVSVLVLTAGPYRFGLASASGIAGNLVQAGETLARDSRIAAGPSTHAAIMLLADCLAGNLQELVQGIYRVTGPQVAISGGAAGDELKFERTFVFHDDRVIQGGAAALWIACEKPIKVATRHGFEPIGSPMLVTRAKGTEILELGGLPASVAYEEQLGFAPAQLSIDKFWATSIVHPLGLLQADGTTVIRVARSKTEQGALRIQGCVPPAGSAVQVMNSSPEALLDVANQVVRELLAGNEEAGVLLLFSCAARAVIFGPRVSEESGRLQAESGEIPTFGFYCCGEFARTAGVLGTHNATLTAFAL